MFLGGSEVHLEKQSVKISGGGLFFSNVANFMTFGLTKNWTRLACFLEHLSNF